MKAKTTCSARQHFGAGRKSSIEVVNLADLAVFSKEPPAVDPETLDTQTVLTPTEEEIAVSASGEAREPQWVRAHLAAAPFDSYESLPILKLGTRNNNCSDIDNKHAIKVHCAPMNNQRSAFSSPAIVRTRGFASPDFASYAIVSFSHGNRLRMRVLIISGL